MAASSSHAGRTDQIVTLTNLLGQSSQPLPPSLLLHDACSPNTTARLVTDILTDLSHASDDAPLLWCSVSPLTSINPTTLFRNILSSLEAQVTQPSTASGSTAKHRRPEPSLDYFLWRLSTLLTSSPGRIVLVIKDAERIRDLWPEHIWTSLPRLSHLASLPGRICTLFISTLAWAQYRTPSGLTIAHSPITIRFPRLTRADILAILASDFPALWRSYGSTVASAQMHAGTSPALVTRSTTHKLKSTGSGAEVTQEALRALHDQFCGVFYDSIRANVRDVDEARTMCAAVWHSFVVPVQTRECSVGEIQPLLLAAGGLFRDVLVRLQTREVGPREWTQQARIGSIQASAARLSSTAGDAMEGEGDVEMVDEARRFDEEEWLAKETQTLARLRDASSQATIALLPSLALIPTFLVIASFLASYNPSRLDVRYFLRDDSLLSLSSGSAKGKSLKGGRKLGPGRGRAGGKKGRPSKSALRVTTDGQTENLNRQQLLGPKPFPIDRLLAIFQALVTEAAPEMSLVYAGMAEEAPVDRSGLWEYRGKTLSVYSQINGLVSRRMLVRTSAQDKLGTSINFRTNVGYGVVSVLAKRVRFELDEWLWDWGAGGSNGL